MFLTSAAPSEEWINTWSSYQCELDAINETPIREYAARISKRTGTAAVIDRLLVAGYNAEPEEALLKQASLEKQKDLDGLKKRYPMLFPELEDDESETREKAMQRHRERMARIDAERQAQLIREKIDAEQQAEQVNVEVSSDGLPVQDELRIT